MLSSERILAAVGDLPRQSESGHTDLDLPGLQLAGQARAMLLASLGSLPDYVNQAARQIWDYVGARGKLVCWSEQRAEAWKTARVTGRHVPQWDTVRVDRRGLYELMTNAMILRGLVAEDNPRPPFWAYVASTAGGEPMSELRELVCDSSCGRGIPVCDSRHVPPGHVAVLLDVDPDEAVPSNYSRWDFALKGAYVPADQLDSARFRHLLETYYPDPASAPTSARSWAPVLQWLARASAVRVFDLTPGAPGTNRDADGDTTIFYAARDHAVQVAIPALRRSQVRRVVRGPSWRHAERWWDCEVEGNPRSALYRRHACLPIDGLASPGTADDSA